MDAAPETFFTNPTFGSAAAATPMQQIHAKQTMIRNVFIDRFSRKRKTPDCRVEKLLNALRLRDGLGAREDLKLERVSMPFPTHASRRSGFFKTVRLQARARQDEYTAMLTASRILC
jgi:hypothetical protein